MATIRPNDNAPAEDVKYIFPTVTFDLGAGGTFDTDDRDALAQAAAHPWLVVEYPEVEETAVTRLSRSVPASEDAYSVYGPRANEPFDPDKIREAEAAKFHDLVQPLAVDAGLDQGESAVEGNVAETLATERESDPAPFTSVDDQAADGGKEE